MIRLTEGEWAILEVLWSGERFPLGEIVSALRPKMNWRRNTVHTYLTRMESKGLVKIHRETEPHQYAAAVSREACAQQERKQLLDKVYNGAAGELIAAFLKESHMTQAERDRLRKLLDEMEVGYGKYMELFASDLVGLSDRALTAGGEAAAAEQTVSALAVRCMGGAGGAIDGACVYLWKGYFSAAPPLGGNGETDGGAGVVLGLYCFL